MTAALRSRFIRTVVEIGINRMSTGLASKDAHEKSSTSGVLVGLPTPKTLKIAKVLSKRLPGDPRVIMPESMSACAPGPMSGRGLLAESRRRTALTGLARRQRSWASAQLAVSTVRHRGVYPELHDTLPGFDEANKRRSRVTRLAGPNALQRSGLIWERTPSCGSGDQVDQPLNRCRLRWRLPGPHHPSLPLFPVFDRRVDPQEVQEGSAGPKLNPGCPCKLGETQPRRANDPVPRLARGAPEKAHRSAPSAHEDKGPVSRPSESAPW